MKQSLFFFFILWCFAFWIWHFFLLQWKQKRYITNTRFFTASPLPLSLHPSSQRINKWSSTYMGASIMPCDTNPLTQKQHQFSGNCRRFHWIKGIDRKLETKTAENIYLGLSSLLKAATFQCIFYSTLPASSNETLCVTQLERVTPLKKDPTLANYYTFIKLTTLIGALSLLC